MEKPDWLSNEFYDKLFPNAGEKTRLVYHSYLTRAKLDEEGFNVVHWVRASKSKAETRSKIRLAKICKDYFEISDSDLRVLNALNRQINRERRQGVNQTQKNPEEQMIKLIPLSDTIFKPEKINEMNLFGQFLPPRRRDIVNFKSLEVRDPKINCYERSTDKLFFVCFKNEKFRPTEIYKLEELTFIPENIRQKIREFLCSREQVIGDYNLNYWTRKYKNFHNGITNTDWRHVWANWARTTLPRTQYLGVVGFMDHSLMTSVTTYSF